MTLLPLGSLGCVEGRAPVELAVIFVFRCALPSPFMYQDLMKAELINFQCDFMAV